MSMTKEELSVISQLVIAWNNFLLLPVEHPDEQEEFRRAIHAAQNIVAARSGYRSISTGAASGSGQNLSEGATKSTLDTLKDANEEAVKKWICDTWPHGYGLFE